MRIGGKIILEVITSHQLEEDYLIPPHTQFFIGSFSDDPVGAANSGRSAGGHRFKGSEQLQVQFSSPLATPYNLEIYAYVEGALETTPVYIKKVTL